MGLDMYLYQLAEDKKPVNVKADYTGPDDEEVYYEAIGFQVAYWRKANAVHAYFVDQFQGGVDECQRSDEITVNNLKVVYDRARQALVDRNPELFTPRAGFFFGEAAVDVWYWGSLVDTVGMLHPIIQQNFYKPENAQPKFIYQSSW